MILKKISQEPLLHFLALASLFFMADMLYSARQKQQIIISQPTIDYLIKQRESLALHVLSAEEKQQTINAFVEDEILYLEAYKQGLDRRDTRMRRNLIRKMRGLLMGEVEEPTQQDLLEFYQQNQAKYTYPKSVSLQQVFFRHDSVVPVHLLKQLNNGLATEDMGDTTLSFGRKMSAYSNEQLVQTLGPQLASPIIAINDQYWHGPLRSTYGVHFVRISERHPPVIAPFANIQNYLATDWMTAQTQQLVQDKINTLRQNYDIQIAHGEQ